MSRTTYGIYINEFPEPAENKWDIKTTKLPSGNVCLTVSAQPKGSNSEGLEINVYGTEDQILLQLRDLYGASGIAIAMLLQKRFEAQTIFDAEAALGRPHDDIAVPA